MPPDNLNSSQFEQSTNTLGYRAEIDGLRAIAVLAVIGFHFFPGYVPGGYVGVDIFFVISGFLISSIIFQSQLKGSFSFFDFYSRRIRRIFPALFIVLFFSLGIGLLCLTSVELTNLGKHIASASVFISNFVYWRESGYFDNSADTKALLHLWSLAIEEQFYIFWPLLIWLAWKIRKGIPSLIIGLLIVSFILNLVNINYDASGTFYSPLTRCWELLLGALLARCFIQGDYASASLNKKYSDLASLLGIFLISFSILLFSKETVFPSWRALLPVLGAALIIASPSSFINRKVFSSRSMVAIGLISYPLYLWHWPLLYFINTTKYQIFDGLNGLRATKVIAIFLAIFLASLTYHVLEKPIRHKSKSIKSVVILISLMLMMGISGFYLYRNMGHSIFGVSTINHYSDQVQKIIDASKFRSYATPKLEYQSIVSGNSFKTLGTGQDNIILVIGDSHAFQYWGTFAKITEKLPESSFRILLNDQADFPPRIDEKIVNNPNIKIIIFSYFWALKYGSTKVHQEIRCCGNGNGGIIGSKNSPLLNPHEQNRLDEQFKGITKQLISKGKTVYFILDNPFGEELDANLMIDRSPFSIQFKTPKSLLKTEAIERDEPIRKRIQSIAQLTNAKTIDPIHFLCSELICPAIDKNGELLYKDYDHLSPYATENTVEYLNFLFMKP